VSDSGMRSLKSLSDNASTSRVLNLSRVNTTFKSDPDYRAKPFFSDPNLNRAIFVKHRLRSDETYLLPGSQGVATKIVFPFDATLLKSGGRSIFVGQIGYREAMAEFLGPTSPQTQHDLSILALLESLPSLDPFLLKEHLARHNHSPADCYFDISQADMARMRAFVREEIGQLISLAFGSMSSTEGEDATAKLVDALMAHDAGARLDPLRITLGLEGHAFHEGVFCWKGFLYYKWLFAEIAKKVNRVLSEMDLVRFEDRPANMVVEAMDAQSKRPGLARRF
jgi:hypothetical protein